MKDTSRAIRRHHAARLKKARRLYFVLGDKTDPRCRGMVVDTPKPCSCWMCSNRRRHEGRTAAELRHLVTLAEFIAC